MSSWNVIQVVTPLMMQSVKMNIIIPVMTLMTITSGSPQTCLHYCKLSPAASSFPPPECDCSFYHLRKPRSTNHHIVTPSDIREIYNEPAKLKPSRSQSFHEKTFQTPLNFSSSLDFTHDSPDNTKINFKRNAYNTSKSFAIQDIFDEHNRKYSHKYKTRNNDVQDMVGKTKDHPLHLYLDIDLDTSENSNKSQLEELKNMFENFQGTENDLSECINLHIYIFSKYVDKTNSNWNPINDTLSKSQELTEIQNKCGQSSSIIKQSLYQIKLGLPEKKTTSEETIYSLESKEDKISKNKRLKSGHNKNSTVSNYPDTSTTDSTYEDYNITPEISVTEDFNDGQADISLLINDYLTKPSGSTSSIPTYNDDAILSPTEDNASHRSASISVFSDRGTLRINNTSRLVYNEADIQIPKIITKEISNDRVLSVVDGNEEIPNSDFITNSISLTTTDEIISNDGHTLNASISNADLLTTIDNIDKSNLAEIRGNLYVLFGKKKIPARFIQQPHGELYVAIDGFSLCDQMLEENKTNFMNSFCNCIQLQNN